MKLQVCGVRTLPLRPAVATHQGAMPRSASPRCCLPAPCPSSHQPSASSCGERLQLNAPLLRGSAAAERCGNDSHRPPRPPWSVVTGPDSEPSHTSPWIVVLLLCREMMLCRGSSREKLRGSLTPPPSSPRSCSSGATCSQHCWFSADPLGASVSSRQPPLHAFKHSERSHFAARLWSCGRVRGGPAGGRGGVRRL